MERLSCRVPDEREIREFAKELNEIAGRNGIAVAGCAASVDIGTCNTCGNGGVLLCKSQSEQREVQSPEV